MNGVGGVTKSGLTSGTRPNAADCGKSGVTGGMAADVLSATETDVKNGAKTGVEKRNGIFGWSGKGVLFYSFAKTGEGTIKVI